MSESIEKRVTDILHFLERITGCKLKDLEGKSSFKGTIGAYIEAKDLFTINGYILNREYEIAYEKEILFLKNCIYDSRFSKDFDKLINDCKEFGQILLEAHDIFREYSIWFAEERKHFRDYLFNNEFLKEEEKTEEFLDRFSYEWVALAKKSVQSKLLQLYNFGKASNTTLDFGHTVPYSISDALCISDNLGICLGRPKDVDEDRCYVRLSLKIDRELMFSYFIITVQYKDRTWLITDKPSFANPRSKQSRRNPARLREDAFENIQLPYGILDDIDNWRKESKSIAKENSSEVYIKSIRDFLPAGSKILIKLIIEELIYNVIPLKQYDLKRIASSQETIKLLGNGEAISTGENVFIDINTEANDERVRNIVYPPSTEIVKINPITAVAKYVEEETLCTVDEMQNLAIWSQKEEERICKQKILDEAYTRDRMRADEESLNKLLFDNLEKVYEVAFSGDTVFMLIEDEKMLSFGSNSDTILQICDTEAFTSCYCHQYITNYHKEQFKSFDHVAKCVVCGYEKPTNLMLKIFSYKALCVLLGIDRQKLPLTFQNYSAYMYVPYVGNTILDNVNPEYLIQDARSRKHNSYYSIGIPLNKRCFNQIRKKYHKYDKSLVVMNYEKGTIEIKDYDIWKEKN